MAVFIAKSANMATLASLTEVKNSDALVEPFCIGSINTFGIDPPITKSQGTASITTTSDFKALKVLNKTAKKTIIIGPFHFICEFMNFSFLGLDSL